MTKKPLVSTRQTRLKKDGSLAKPSSQLGSKHKPSGRQQALRVLDKMLSRKGNQARLLEDLQLEFRADPTKFFKDIIMPLLPKEAVIKSFEGDQAKVGLRILFAPALPEPSPDVPAGLTPGSVVTNNRFVDVEAKA